MATRFLKSLGELVRFALITLAIVVPIRVFVAQPFIVSGASMAPTFESSEYLIVDELSYYLRQPQRGEVIIFRYPKDPSKHFIKRIIGLPGETIEVKSDQVVIKRGETEQVLTEPYAQGGFWGNLEVTLGPGEYFVLGDNRSVSLDSRNWGPLPENLITGRALLRLFPFSQLSFLPGQDYEKTAD